jgi:predicted phosphodiesterase
MPAHSLDFPFPARIISDLHLGHEICEVHAAWELEPLLHGIKTLILNGDTLQARLPRYYQRSLELMQGLFALCDAKEVQRVMLNGNHDPDSWPVDGVELFDGKLFISHGHAFFRHVSPWSSKLRYCCDALEQIWAEYTPEQLAKLETRYALAKRCSVAMIPTEVRQKEGFFGKIQMALRQMWPPSRTWTVMRVWAGLPKLVNAFLDEFCPQVQVVCFGHTHRAAWWEKQGRLLVNTGGFISFATPLCVDISADGELKVRRIYRKDGCYHVGAVVVHRWL